MRVLISLCLVLLGLAPASAADIKLLTAGTFKPVALELVPEFEKRTGHKVTIENDTAGGLAKRLAAGEHFDVIVMPPAGMAQFLGNKVVQSSGKPLVRTTRCTRAASRPRHASRRQRRRCCGLSPTRTTCRS